MYDESQMGLGCAVGGAPSTEPVARLPVRLLSRPSFVATGDASGNIDLFHRSTRAKLLGFSRAYRTAESAGFMVGSRFLVSCSDDRTARIWPVSRAVESARKTREIAPSVAFVHTQHCSFSSRHDGMRAFVQGATFDAGLDDLPTALRWLRGGEDVTDEVWRRQRKRNLLPDLMLHD